MREEGMSSKIAKAMEINPRTGTSKVWKIDELSRIIGVQLRTNNGSPYFQSDRGIGKKYSITKQMDDKNIRLESVRATGFASYFNANRNKYIPAWIKKEIKKQPCIFCGKNHSIEVDHKDGQKDPIDNPLLKDFQPLCTSCNGVKRSACNHCKESGVRYNAKIIGYPMSYASGNSRFFPHTRRCVGCLLFDVKAFRDALEFNKDKYIEPEITNEAIAEPIQLEMDL